jgi:hypothetical protein
MQMGEIQKAKAESPTRKSGAGVLNILVPSRKRGEQMAVYTNLENGLKVEPG